MTQTKNRTCYVSTAPIVPQRFADGKELAYLTDENLQLIKKTPFVQYDLGPSGILQAGLRGRGELAFDINTLDEDDVDSLIRACLHGKMVVGYDLYKSFTFTRLRTERLMPSIMLDIPSLMRIFGCFAPLVEGMMGFEQLISMTRTTDIHEAIVQIFDLDKAENHNFLSIFERIPWKIAGLCSDAIRAMELGRMYNPNMGYRLLVDFSKKNTRLMSTEEAISLGFNPYYLASVNDEFRIAVESLRDILGFREKEEA